MSDLVGNTKDQFSHIKAHILYPPGTYNNQYMVLDLKQIELNKEIRDNALWVVEQIPGYVGMADVTDILREGISPVTSNEEYMMIVKDYFAYFFIKIYVVGTH